MKRVEIALPGGAPAISHYTDAVRFGDTLYVSGIVALDAKGEVLCKGDVVGQAEEIFRTLKGILDMAGATFADVLKVTVFLKDVADRPAVNEVRKRYFGSAKPASTLIGVAALAFPDFLIEIEAVVGLRD